MESINTVVMYATVLQTGSDSLLVCDQDTSQEVLVHTPQASCFSVGNRVCIVFNGAMTLSIPPQISAIRIHQIRC